MKKILSIGTFVSLIVIALLATGANATTLQVFDDFEPELNSRAYGDDADARAAAGAAAGAVGITPGGRVSIGDTSLSNGQGQNQDQNQDQKQKLNNTSKQKKQTLMLIVSKS